MAKVTFEPGDILELRVERQPIYADSARHATYKESKLVLEVARQFDDGRYSLRATRESRIGGMMLKRVYVLSADLEYLNSYMGRPLRYVVFEVAVKRGTKKNPPGREPRVWYFHSSGEAYDQTQVDDRIKDGDVLVVKSEKVAGFLYQAWPVAVTEERGELHGLEDEGELPERYARSVEMAHLEATLFHLPAPYTEPHLGWSSDDDDFLDPIDPETGKKIKPNPSGPKRRYFTVVHAGDTFHFNIVHIKPEEAGYGFHPTLAQAKKAARESLRMYYGVTSREKADLRRRISDLKIGDFEDGEARVWV